MTSSRASPSSWQAVADWQVLARLRVTPSGGIAPAVQTFTLERQEDTFRLVIVERNGFTRQQTRRRIPISSAIATERLETLRKLTVPAYPISPGVCDGEQLELTVEGESSRLTVSWWTIAPQCAEGLSEFAQWLRDVGSRQREDQEGGND